MGSRQIYALVHHFLSFLLLLLTCLGYMRLPFLLLFLMWKKNIFTVFAFISSFAKTPYNSPFLPKATGKSIYFFILFFKKCILCVCVFFFFNIKEFLKIKIFLLYLSINHLKIPSLRIIYIFRLLLVFGFILDLLFGFLITFFELL